MTQKGLNEGTEKTPVEDNDNVMELHIDSVAHECKEYQGNLSRGVKVNDTWYNVRGNTKEDVDAMFGEDLLARGNTVEVELGTGNTITKIVKLVKKAEGRHEDDMLSLNDLLADAHKNGLVGIKTQIIAHDPEKKMAVVKAMVYMMVKQEQKKTEAPEPPTIKEYHAHGDADQTNISSETVKVHYLRMAETRAICRSLRWATNNARVSKEECNNEK